MSNLEQCFFSVPVSLAAPTQPRGRRSEPGSEVVAATRVATTEVGARRGCDRCPSEPAVPLNVSSYRTFSFGEVDPSDGPFGPGVILHSLDIRRGRVSMPVAPLIPPGFLRVLHFCRGVYDRLM